MIVPMKKVSLIVKGDKKTDVLKTLRKLGILHIEITEGAGKNLEKLKEKYALLESALFSISEKKVKNADAVNADLSETVSVAEKVLSLEEEKKQCLAERLTLHSELERLKNWGEIDPQEIGRAHV